jgi:hypothetical protein
MQINKHYYIIQFESFWSNVSLGKQVTHRSSLESNYSFTGLADVHLVLGECKGNATDDVRRYGEKYPNRRVENHYTFLSADRQLREAGIFHGMQWDVCR